MTSVISPIKIASSQYYVHRSYVNSYYYVYIFLEDWIVENIFRKDSSRVFMSSPEYAFRRRFELTDMSVSYDEIDASSLRFPFANYWPQNTGWSSDDRYAGNTAAQVYQGVYVGNTLVKAASVIHSIPVTFYFDREDDARLAYDTLFFYTYNLHYYSTEVPYAGNNLGIPIALNIKNLQFNPSFKEKDWLTKNRIFVITANFDCRSYAIRPPVQPDYNVSLDVDGRLSDGTGMYNDGYDTYYIVDDAILNLTNQNWRLETYEGVDKSFPSEGEAGVIYTDSLKPEEGYNAPPKMYVWMKDWIDPENPGEPKDQYVPISSKYLAPTGIYTGDSIRYEGTLEESAIKFKQFGQTYATTESVTVSWEFEENIANNTYEETLTTTKNFSYKIPKSFSLIDFYINGEESSEYSLDGNTITSLTKLEEGTVCKVIYWLIEKIGVYTENGAVETYLGPKTTSYTITDLTPNCSYLIYVNFYMCSGVTKKLGCIIKTLQDSEPFEEKSIQNDQLIGISW